MKTAEDIKNHAISFAKWLRENTVENGGLWLMRVEETFNDEEIYQEYLNWLNNQVKPAIEIIGTGYGKDVNIGESYLKENVINMWDSAPEGAFVYYSDGIRMTLQELTKVSENGYKSRTLSKEEITSEIRQALINKGLTVPSYPHP